MREIQKSIYGIQCMKYKIHCQSHFFTLFWESITKDKDVSCIFYLMTTFHCWSKADTPNHVPCLWINASPCSIWYIIFLIADSGNSLFLYKTERKKVINLDYVWKQILLSCSFGYIIWIYENISHMLTWPDPLIQKT